MANGYHDDELLMEQIKSGDRLVVKRTYELYRNAYKLFLIRYYGANEQDALDSYPETFTKFYFNIVNQKLLPPLKSSLKTYLFSIGKHVFHKRYFSKYKRSTDLKEEMEDQAIGAEVLDMYEQDERATLVSKLLGQMNEKCKQLLTLIYIKGYDSEAVVAETDDLKNAGAMRKRKHDCLKKMRKIYAEMNF